MERNKPFKKPAPLVKLIKPKRIETQAPTTIRLNKYISNAGICSRREADKLIANGQISVNDNVVTKMAYKVNPQDVIKHGKKVLKREKLIYVLLNKPKDFLTTIHDPKGRKTVMSLIKNAGNERIYPIGQLDRNTTGLLLFTNDGDLTKKLSHPSHKMHKLYKVELDTPITEAHFNQITSGLKLEDGMVHVKEFAIVGMDRNILGIDIDLGKHRIVRRIFEHLGYNVVKLDRVIYGGLTKKNLGRGKWRFLTKSEIIKLKHLK